MVSTGAVLFQESGALASCRCALCGCHIRHEHFPSAKYSDVDLSDKHRRPCE